MPVVPFSSGREPVRFVDVNLRRNARTDEDGVYWRRVDFPRRVELRQPDVRVSVLKIRREVLVLEDCTGHTPDVNQRHQVNAADEEDGAREPDEERRYRCGSLPGMSDEVGGSSILADVRGIHEELFVLDRV